MTSISKMELINRMKKRLVDAKEEHNKIIKSLNKPNSRILKNFSKYDQLELSPIKIDESLTDLIKKLNTNIKTARIKIIKADNVEIEEVFELFYQNKPPFSSNEKKRYEFPDAFILKSIETWSIKNKKKMIFLSKDKDFNGYKSRNLLFRDNIVEILDNITQYYDSLQETQLIPRINEQLQNNRDGILMLIKEQLNQIITLEIDYENVSKLDFTKIKLISSKITSIRPSLAEVTYFAEIEYKFIIYPSINDFIDSVFEDNLKPKRFSGKLKIPCDFEIGLKRNNDIKLKWINSNEKIRLTLENNYS